MNNPPKKDEFIRKRVQELIEQLVELLQI